MDTYSRGQWGKDDDFSDSFTFTKTDIESSPQIVMGPELQFHLEVHAFLSETSKYLFLANLTDNDTFISVLLPDVGSLLMFMKEISPIIELSIKQELMEIQQEEHRLKMKTTIPSHLHDKFCHHHYYEE